MARGRGQGPQRHVKGFRPGKEPPRLRAEHAKRQFKDVSASQARLIEMFAQRTPEEARSLIRRWRITLLSAGIGLAVLGAFLMTWSWLAGLGTFAIAGVVLFFWWRIHREREAYQALADQVSGGGGGRGGRGKN